jgi:hypothetical protein
VSPFFLSLPSRVVITATASFQNQSRLSPTICQYIKPRLRDRKQKI